MTKSIRGTSTFHCEQACDYEKEFNCRSYTYLDNPDGSVAPGGNLCLLSADNRATSHQGSMQFRPRALYAEKDCAYQKWSNAPPVTTIGNVQSQPSIPQSPPPSASLSPPTPPVSAIGRIPEYGGGQPQSAPQPVRFYDPPTLTNQASGSGIVPQPDQSTIPMINPRTMNHDQMDHFNGPMGPTMVDPDIYQQQQQQSFNYSHGLQHPYQTIQSNSYSHQAQLTLDDISQHQHIPARCTADEYSFEKTFGYDLRYARRERAPIPSRPGVADYCKEECIRMGERCRAFVVEYGEQQQQNCYFLDEAALENRNQLNKIAGFSYNEKICLKGFSFFFLLYYNLIQL